MGTKFVYFLTKSSLTAIPSGKYKNEVIVIGKKEIEKFNHTYSTIKSYLFGRVCEQIVIDKKFLKKIYDNNDYLITFVKSLTCEKEKCNKKQLQFMFP